MAGTKPIRPSAHNARQVGDVRRCPNQGPVHVEGFVASLASIDRLHAATLGGPTWLHIGATPLSQSGSALCVPLLGALDSRSPNKPGVGHAPTTARSADPRASASRRTAFASRTRVLVRTPTISKLAGF